MNEQDEIIEMADKADAEADNVLNMKGEYHPNWHQVRDEIFAKLIAAKERERLAILFDKRDTGAGFYEPHEPAEIIRAGDKA